MLKKIIRKSSFILINLIFLFNIFNFSIRAQTLLLDSEPLSSEEAFQVDYLLNSQTEVIIRWEIEKSYYLYKKKIQFKSEDYFIDQVKLPVGKIKEDPYFGKSEVYYEIVEAKIILIPKSKKNSKGTIVIEYQGCWDGGVCYPVEKYFLKI